MTKDEYKTWQRKATPSKKIGSKKGGYDRDWQQVRKYMLATAHYLCQLNLTEECTPAMPRVATEVDHLVPILIRPDLRLDPRNLRASCRHCNRAKVFWDKTHPAEVQRLSDAMPPLSAKDLFG